MTLTEPTKRARTAAVLLGIGLGGFVDGIVLHQILQWHHMLSSSLPPTTMEAMRTNMLWDGVFHAGVWAATLAGVFLLWRAARSGTALPPTRWFVGFLVLGWGLFNLVEGAVNHQILGLHHVRYVPDMAWDQPSLAWDLGFLVLGGLVLIGLGWWLTRDRAPS